jgi:N6-L-threonylcarbamoyladenine synthase
LSIGRAFDKTAKLLRLPWADKLGPGAALEAFAATASEDDAKNLLPTRIPAPGRLHLSYAGTFSLVGRAIDAYGGIDMMSLEQRARLAKDFQTAAVAQLEEKVILALRACELKGENVQHVIVSGGVASNSYLRER